MSVIQGLFGGGGGVDAGKINNLCFCGMNFCLMMYCANYFRSMMLNKKKKSPESKTTSAPWIYFLMILIPLCRSLSLLLKVFCSPSLALTIACNFLSEAPMLFLFILICTGWPLVKPLLLPKDKLILVGIVLIECFLAPALNITAFHVKGSYTPNQYYESFDLFRYSLLFLSYKSSTHFLKDLAISTQGMAYASVSYIQLYRYLFCYYSVYWFARAILAYSTLNSSYYYFFLNEFFFMVLCVAFAYEFIPELLYIDCLLPDCDVDDDNFDFLLNDEDQDQEADAIKALADY